MVDEQTAPVSVSVAVRIHRILRQVTQMFSVQRRVCAAGDSAFGLHEA